MGRPPIRNHRSDALVLWAILQCSWLAAIPAGAQTPAQDGVWSDPFDLPLIAIHAATLPTGMVLLFGSEHGVPGIHGWVLDPQSLELTEVPPGWDLNCSGHNFLADGRLLVGGGTLLYSPLTGPKVAYVFDPFTLLWSRVEDMARGRWYPTHLTLADGRTVTMSGLNDTTGELNPDIELYDPDGTSNWELLGPKLLPVYPLLHLMPTGLVFLAGPDPQTESFNPSDAQWATVDTTNFPGRYEAPSVLLPPTLNRVMLIGGYQGSGQPTNSAEIIDFTDATPQWSLTAHMASPRMEHNAVLMPDAKVLAVGGRSNNGSPATPVLIPELFDPMGPSWDQLAPHQVPRRYHSTAVLLADGRVLAAGGDYEPSAEILSPPYLFNGSRPLITSAPAVIAYDSTFDLEFTDSTGANEVVLIRLSSVTHSVNMGQRYVRLGEGVLSGAPASIVVPSAANLGPPGYYMLFVVSDTGIPSVSRIVKFVAGFSALDSDNDGVDDALDCDSSNEQVWDAPGEVQGVSLDHDFQTGVTTLTWPAPSTGLGGASVGYDTLRSTQPDGFLGMATCLEAGGADLAANDADPIGAGVVFYYLVRATNLCLPGSLGTALNGVPRSGIACP